MKKENKMTPELRFPGYTDDWEQRKVGDVITEASRPIEMKDNQLYQLVTVKRRNEGVVSRGFFYGKDILVKNYFEIRKGDYLISKRQLVHGANGQVPENLDKSIVSNEYMVCVGNENMSAEFLTILSKTKKLKRDFFLSSYGVDIEKLVFDVSDWKKRTIVYPGIKEQDTICAFFRHIDNTITLHQRKLDQMKEYKKGMLQKMFPKKGERVPEIRFPGFTGDWEQRKLGEIGRAKSGTGFPDAEQGGTEGIPFFKVSDMNTEGNENELVVASNYVTDEQISRKRWNVIDDVPAIFFAKVGAAVMLNRKRLVRSPFLLDNNTMAYIFDKTIWDCNFGKTLFETIDLTRLTQVGALPSYNASDVEEVCIAIPGRAEQEVIGKYFKQIDKLITLHQRKLESMKEYKKGLLQKMFV